MPELLERTDLSRGAAAERDAEIPSHPPAGLETALFEHDERASRAELRRQIAALEAELGRLFVSSFPRTGIEFGVPSPGGGPRVLPVDELERVRDGLLGRLAEARAALGERTRGEERMRGLIERMSADPGAHKWIRVSNEDIGEPGCRHWHSRPRWGVLGMLVGWWRVKVSSGCPLAGGPAVGGSRTKSRAELAQKRKRRRRRRAAATSRAGVPGSPSRGAEAPAAPSPVQSDGAARGRAARVRGAKGPPPPPWGSFPLSEIVVLVALVLLLLGFFIGPPQGPVMLATGLVLGSLAGLELAVREHFAGYRSHTLLLAGAAGIAVIIAAALIAGLAPLIAAIAGAAVFGALAWPLATAFRNRSGGALFRAGRG